MDREKVIAYLDRYERILGTHTDEWAMFVGICHVQLGHYEEAKSLFERSILAMFHPPMIWKGSAQPHRLVDVCVLSGRQDLYAQVGRELETYRRGRKRDSLLYVYAKAVIGLLLSSGEDMAAQVQILQEDPKIKMWHAAGLALRAVLDREPAGFNAALKKLLEAHEGQTTRGGLRATAEGLLCMPAMSLAYAARKLSLKLEGLESQYFSQGYLEFLLKMRN